MQDGKVYAVGHHNDRDNIAGEYPCHVDATATKKGNFRFTIWTHMLMRTTNSHRFLLKAKFNYKIVFRSTGVVLGVYESPTKTWSARKPTRKFINCTNFYVHNLNYFNPQLKTDFADQIISDFNDWLVERYGGERVEIPYHATQSGHVYMIGLIDEMQLHFISRHRGVSYEYARECFSERGNAKYELRRPDGTYMMLSAKFTDRVHILTNPKKARKVLSEAVALCPIKSGRKALMAQVGHDFDLGELVSYVSLGNALANEMVTYERNLITDQLHRYYGMNNYIPEVKIQLDRSSASEILRKAIDERFDSRLVQLIIDRLPTVLEIEGQVTIENQAQPKAHKWALDALRSCDGAKLQQIELLRDALRMMDHVPMPRNIGWAADDPVRVAINERRNQTTLRNLANANSIEDFHRRQTHSSNEEEAAALEIQRDMYKGWEPFSPHDAALAQPCAYHPWKFKIRRPDELGTVGRLMGICVGSYAGYVMRGDRTIVTLNDEHDIDVCCIEIDREFNEDRKTSKPVSIVQAKLRRNNYAGSDPDVKQEIELWAQQHNLKISTRDMTSATEW